MSKEEKAIILSHVMINELYDRQWQFFITFKTNGFMCVTITTPIDDFTFKYNLSSEISMLIVDFTTDLENI